MRSLKYRLSNMHDRRESSQQVQSDISSYLWDEAYDKVENGLVKIGLLSLNPT